MACQTHLGLIYSKSLIIRSYLHVCVVSSGGLFYSLSYRIRIIYKQINLTHRWDSNSYYHSWPEWIKKLFQSLPRSPELEPNHFLVGMSYPTAENTEDSEDTVSVYSKLLRSGGIVV